MLIDSHCHLDFPDFNDDREEIIARARRNGVGRMISIVTRLDRFEATAAISARYPEVYMGVGVHPLEAGEAGLESVAPLLEVAEHPRVVGMGESGLDYHYRRDTREKQLVNFRVHIQAARETGLPLIVHTRDADADTVAMLQEEHAKGAFPCVIHCFTAGRALAEACIAMGHYISFTGIITFKKSTEIQAIAKDLPIDRILVETDAPYLAPVPKRGKRNEPAYVAHTAQYMAGLRGMSADAFIAQTGENFFRLFSKVPQTDLTEAAA